MNRRSTALIVVLLCIALCPASAQKITGGLKMGLNLASWYGDDLYDAKIKPGFCGGGFGVVALGHIAVIQPELLYSQKGVKWEEALLGLKLTYEFNYIEMPVLVKMILHI